jgi:hypothetical protein
MGDGRWEIAYGRWQMETDTEAVPIKQGLTVR